MEDQCVCLSRTDASHKPRGRLPLLSAMLLVTFVAEPQNIPGLWLTTKLHWLVTEAAGV